MQILWTKKKKILTLILLVVLIILIAIAAYFLFWRNKNDNTADGPFFQNCLEEEEGKYLCKGLMLEITSNTDTCVDLILITSSNTLETQQVCGDESLFVFSNEILNYKKLMPFSAEITASDGIINNIQFSESTVNVEELINQDIGELTSFNITEEMISPVSNSYDNCPKNLPDYVSQKDTYHEFLSSKILTRDQYDVYDVSNTENNIINTLFLCDSSNKLQYNLCTESISNSNLSTLSELLPSIGIDTNRIGANINTNMENRYFLKYITSIYDTFLLKDSSKVSNISPLISSIFTNISRSDSLSTEVLCSLEKLYGLAGKNDDVTILKDIISDNVANIRSGVCIDSLQNMNSNGLYILLYYSNSLSQYDYFTIYNRCLNLNNILEE